MLSADKENNFIYKLVANEREISEHTSNYQKQAVIKVFADIFVRMSKMQDCRLQYMQVIGTPPLGPGLSHCSVCANVNCCTNSPSFRKNILADSLSQRETPFRNSTPKTASQLNK